MRYHPGDPEAVVLIQVAIPKEDIRATLASEPPPTTTNARTKMKTAPQNTVIKSQTQTC